MFTAFFMSLFDALNVAASSGLLKADVSGIMDVIYVIPLAREGFAWLIPTVIGCIAGLCLGAGRRRKCENDGTLYRNGKIFTADDNCLYADAMIVEGGVVRWAGQEADLDRGAAEGLAQTDLGGACVIPGFVDAHMHPVMLADFAAQISALPPKVHSIAELTEEIRRVRAAGERGPRRGELGRALDRGLGL